MSEQVPPYGPPGYRGGDPKAQAKAEKAYRKASRPWYKKKRVLLPAGLVALIVIAGVAGGGSGGGDDTSTTVAAPPAASGASSMAPSAAAASTAPASPSPASPAYAGALKGDKVGAPGASLMLSGWTVTASPLTEQKAAYAGATPTVCTTVTLVNRDKVAQPYNIFSWKMQDSAGGVKNSSFTGDNLLSSGEVAPGGTAQGNACFDTPAAAGQTLVIWEPDFTSRDRAVWLNAL